MNFYDIIFKKNNKSVSVKGCACTCTCTTKDSTMGTTEEYLSSGDYA